MTITGRLLLINSLICCAFGVVLAVVFLSYNSIEKALTSVFIRETNTIIDNSHVTRELSRLLFDFDIVLRSFYLQGEVIQRDGARLLVVLDDLAHQAKNGELQTSLPEFRQRIGALLQQCEEISTLRQQIVDVEDRFNKGVEELDEAVAEKLVELIVNGEDTSEMEQLSSLIGGYRASFKRIELSFVELGIEYFKSPLRTDNHPLQTPLQDLKLRLRTLTASSPSIAELGRRLMMNLDEYGQLVPQMHTSATSLQVQLDETMLLRDKLLSIMEKSDIQIGQKTKDTSQFLSLRIRTILLFNLIIFVAVLPLVLLGFTTARSINKPIQKVIEYINKISKGDIPDPLEDKFKNEFAEVGENLNLLIATSNNVTQLAENIASGNIKTTVEERSPNDRLTQALNSMINGLSRLQKETDQMIHGVTAGRLEVQGDAEGFQGGWKKLVVGINELIGGLRSAVSESTALNKEMELAKHIQTALLPDELSELHPDLEISAAMVPAKQVGGDFYEVSYDKGDNLWITIGDVSGHGVTPGLIMMMAQTIQASISANLELDARSMVMRLNEILYENVHQRLQETHFMTFQALKYLGRGAFQYAGAHLSMMVVRQKTNQIEMLPSRGVYLNLKRDISKATVNNILELSSGDSLILYTDGMTEAVNDRGEFLDVERFGDIILRYAQSDADTMKKNIMEDVLEWCGNNQEDDMTVVIVKLRGQI